MLPFIIFLLFIVFTSSWSIEKFGALGDFAGGIIGTIIAFVALAYTYKTFHEQVLSNLKQREDIALERFENNLFNMISIHEQITSSLRYINEDIDPTHSNIPEGRALFEYLYNRRNFGWHKGLRHTIEESTNQGTSFNEEELKKIRQDKSFGCLDHYFAHLLSILKYIDNTPTLRTLDQKREYVMMVTSTISEYELLILFYYVLLYSQENDNSFKELIERYAIMESLRVNYLATQIERDFYSQIKSEGNNVQSQVPEPYFNKEAFLYKNRQSNRNDRKR